MQYGDILGSFWIYGNLSYRENISRNKNMLRILRQKSPDATFGEIDFSVQSFIQK